ncbi:MAG: VRR-NUC domain-containing protein [Deltaproteobacteria bacterium]|nr:VRR-NUC domain-containing protein [Deltaproteobacteria bacterium]
MLEAKLQQLLLARLNTIPGVWAWRQNTGVARMGGRLVRFGIPGQADISGVIRGGWRLEVEVKSDTGVQSPEQADFQRRLEEQGGLYILARELEPVLAAVRAAIDLEVHRG